jgi:hypothetical protein
VHLALYEGYVKNVNLIIETLKGYAAYGDKASEGDKLAIAELRRRFAFEFDGMRMHEYYFSQFEGEKGGSAQNRGSPKLPQKNTEAERISLNTSKRLPERAASAGSSSIAIRSGRRSTPFSSTTTSSDSSLVCRSSRARPLGARLHGGLCARRQEEVMLTRSLRTLIGLR